MNDLKVTVQNPSISDNGITTTIFNQPEFPLIIRTNGTSIVHYIGFGVYNEGPKLKLKDLEDIEK